MSTVDFAAPPLSLKYSDPTLLFGEVGFFLYPPTTTKKRNSTLNFSLSLLLFSRAYTRILLRFLLIFSFIYFTFLLFVYQMRSLLSLLRRKSEDKAINVAIIIINAEEMTINAEEIIC